MHFYDYDLITQIVGSETLAMEIAAKYVNLTELDEAPDDDLRAFGDEAERLVAARELAHLTLKEKGSRGTQILSPKHAYLAVMPYFKGELREVLVVLGLDVKKRLVAEPMIVAIGHMEGISTTPREILRPLILMGAHSFIIAHNHPSGDPTPSSEDRDLSRKLSEAGTLVGVEMVDHLVVGRGSFESAFC